MSDSQRNSIPALDALSNEFERLSAEVPSPRRRRGVLAVAGSALVAGILVLTPAGSAAIDGFEELTGIGDEPSEERAGGTPEPVAGEIVIGSGTTPGGDPFEIVAYQGRFRQGEVEDGEKTGTCIALDFPGQEVRSGGTTCIDGPQKAPIGGLSVTDSAPSLGESSGITVSSLVAPQVDRVEVSYDETEGEPAIVSATIGHLEGELKEAVEAQEDVGYFVAFIPVGDGLESESLAGMEVRAYADGQLLKTEKYRSASDSILSDARLLKVCARISTKTDNIEDIPSPCRKVLGIE